MITHPLLSTIGEVSSGRKNKWWEKYGRMIQFQEQCSSSLWQITPYVWQKALVYGHAPSFFFIKLREIHSGQWLWYCRIVSVGTFILSLQKPRKVFGTMMNLPCRSLKCRANMMLFMKPDQHSQKPTQRSGTRQRKTCMSSGETSDI